MSPSIPLTTLFLAEGTLKVISGLTFMLSPHSILKHLYPLSLTSHQQQPSYPPISIALTRVFGSQTLAFSIPLFLAARADKHTKKLVYFTVLAREGCLAAILLGQLAVEYLWDGKREGSKVEGGERVLEEGRVGEVKENDVRREVERVALRRGLWVWLAEVAPFVVARVAILGSGAWFV